MPAVMHMRQDRLAVTMPLVQAERKKWFLDLHPGTRVLQGVPVLSHRLEHERVVLLQLRGAPHVLLQLRGVTRERSFKSYTLHGLLPLRLPDRAQALATASANSQFAAFLQELGNSCEQTVPSLPGAIDAIARAGVAKAEDLASGLSFAYQKADSLLNGAELDDKGLNRDEIATLHMYTQEDLSGKGQPDPPNIYRPLNWALRNRQFDTVRVFWLYITLLQRAVLKLPPAEYSLYRGLANPQPPISESV
jgi:hypothetical protein